MNSRAASRWTDGAMQRRVARRYAAERRFKLFGFAAVGLSVAFLAFLLVTMVMKGWIVDWLYARGMRDAHLRLPTEFAEGRSRCFCGAEIDIAGTSPHVYAVHMTT